MKYLFTNVLGSFVLDEQLKIIDSLLFKTVEEYNHKEKAEKKLASKHKDLRSLPEEKIAKALWLFQDQKYFAEFYQKNIQLTKTLIKQSVAEDQLIMQAIANINELDKSNNLLTKRLREWYGLYFPEFCKEISNPEKFVELVAEKSKKELMKEIDFDETESMGAELEKIHVEEIILLARGILNQQQIRKKHEAYLQKVMQKYCPNLLELAGATIGARLIELGKGLKHLAMLPASTIQLLGAEKALFRHIKTGSKSPKYGVIINHPLIQKAKKIDKGKAARMLADKLSLCARLDYFKGEFKAAEYKQELEEKLS